MISVSTKMPYEEIIEISLRSEKSQGRCKSNKSGHPVEDPAFLLTVCLVHCWTG